MEAQSDVYCWFYEQEESNVINRYDTQLTTTTTLSLLYRILLQHYH